MGNKQISDLTTTSTVLENDYLLEIETALGFSEKMPGNVLKSIATVTKIADYTILDDDYTATILIDTTSVDVDITLPTLADNQGRYLSFHNIDDTNLATVVAEGAETIGFDMTSIELAKKGDRLTLFGGATTWIIIDERLSCQLRLDTYAGYGSSDTKIMQFANSREDFGNLFSHNHGSYGTAGLEITINKSGKYSFHFSHREETNAEASGLSLNSSQLSTAIGSINTQDVLSLTFGSIATNIGVSLFSGLLNKNDIIRTHTNGLAPTNTQFEHFTASYLGN